MINLKEDLFFRARKLKQNYTNIVVLILRVNLLLFLLVFVFKLITPQTGLGINTVVIDPGHGGKDPGAISTIIITRKQSY